MTVNYEYMYDEIICHLMLVWCVFKLIGKLIFEMATSCFKDGVLG